jgi:hypothetical protein
VNGVFSVYAVRDFMFVLAERVHSDCGELCTTYTIGGRINTVTSSSDKNVQGSQLLRSTNGSMIICTWKNKRCLAIQING